MDKNEILKKLKGKIDVAFSSVGFSYIVGTGFWIDEMSKLQTPARITIQSEKNSYVFELSSPQFIIKRYQNPENVNRDCMNMIKLSVVDMITQLFERIKEYSIDTKQIEDFKKLPWYHVVRHIRNAFSHNFIFSGINSKDQPNYILVDGIKIVIDESLNRQELDFDNVPLNFCFKLAEIMLSSLRDDLK